MARKKHRSIDALLGSLEKGKVGPVYVLFGPEVFLLDQALEALRDAMGSPDDVSYEVVRGGDATGKDIVGAARTVSMFEPRRLLLVRDAGELKVDEHPPLLEYFEAPVEGTTLVLMASKIDGRRKLYSKAAALGYTYEAAPISERSLPAWIERRAAARGLRLSPEAIEVLGEATGPDLSTLEDSLERLALYVGDGNGVDAKDVEAVVATSRVRSIFELTDAIGGKNVGSALRTLGNMLDNREAPLRILATLTTHIRRLLAAADLGLRNPDELAARLSIHPFAARKVASQARRFEVRELREALIRVSRADRELKIARRPDPLIMEELVLDLCMTAPRC